MKPPDFLFQRTVMGKLKETSVDSEVISFTIPMGFLDIIVIVNIPPEGTTSAPVYIKFKQSKSPDDVAR